MAKRLPKPSPLPSDQMSQPCLEVWADQQRYRARRVYREQVAGLMRQQPCHRPLGPLPELDGELVELRGWRPWGDA